MMIELTETKTKQLRWNVYILTGNFIVNINEIIFAYKLHHL